LNWLQEQYDIILLMHSLCQPTTCEELGEEAVSFSALRFMNPLLCWCCFGSGDDSLCWLLWWKKLCCWW